MKGSPLRRGRRSADPVRKEKKIMLVGIGIIGVLYFIGNVMVSVDSMN